RTAERSAEWTVTTGSLKSLTIVVTKRSPSPANLARLPPLSIVTDVTPVMGVAGPLIGVNVTPVQFMNLLVAGISAPGSGGGRDVGRGIEERGKFAFEVDGL